MLLQQCYKQVSEIIFIVYLAFFLLFLLYIFCTSSISKKFSKLVSNIVFKRKKKYKVILVFFCHSLFYTG
jgi:hypothetical protein